MSLGPTPNHGQRPGAAAQQKETVPVRGMPGRAEGIPTKGIQGGSAEKDRLFTGLFDEVKGNAGQQKRRPAKKKPEARPVTMGDLQEVMLTLLQMMNPVTMQAVPPMQSPAPQMQAQPQMPMPNPQGGIPL